MNGRGEEEASAVRSEILEALGDDVALLSSAMPPLHAFLGDTLPSKKRGANVSEGRRFLPVLGSFFVAVASIHRPVLVLMENLHLADTCSLEFIQKLIGEHHAPGLLFVATCDTGASPDSDLSLALREMEDQRGVTIRDVVLPHMNEAAVESVVAKVLECATSDCTSLCGLITNGQKVSPTYLSLVLQSLVTSRVLYGTSIFGWSWKEREVEEAMGKHPVSLAIQQQVRGLGQRLDKVLTTAACIGSVIDTAVLNELVGFDTHSLLAKTAVTTELIRYDREGKVLSFGSEEIRRVLYEWIPKDDRAAKHWSIGRKLWRKTEGDEQLDRNVFAILSHLCKGVTTLTKEQDKKALATLCLAGGRKAAKLSAFRIASQYLDLGISLLADTSWREDNDLTHSLYTSAAEMAFCDAAFDVSEAYIQSVLRNSRCVDDMVPAYCTQVALFSATERVATAVDTGLYVLTKIGENLPAKPTKSTLLREMLKVQRLLKGKSDEQLLRLPMMINLQKMNAVRVLTQLLLHTIYGHVEMHALVGLRMMQLTLQFGHSVMSGIAFGVYATMLASRQHLEGQRFANLCLQVRKLHGTLEYLPRENVYCYGLALPWTTPYADCLPPLLEAHVVAYQTGDFEAAGNSANVYCCIALEIGKPLDALLDKWTGFQRSMSSTRQEALLRLSFAAVQTIRHLMGKTEDPLNSKGDIYDFDEAAAFTKRAGATKAHVALRMWQMRLAYIFNDYVLASRCALLREFLRMPGGFLTPSVSFFGALVCLAAVRDGRDRRSNLNLAREILGRFKKWALASPENCGGRKMLIEAELASVIGRDELAYEKYIYAIALFRD